MTRILVAPVFLFFVAMSGVAAGEEAANDACLACHGTEGFQGPNERPLFVDGAKFAASAHAAFECTTCHKDASQVPHEGAPKKVGQAVCAGCHEDVVKSYEGSVHGAGRAQGVKEAASCTDCHGGIHAIRPHTEKDSGAHWSHLTAMCAHCHANQELIQKVGIPVVRPVEAYLGSAHARAVENGTHGAVCSDCHGAHDILRAADPRATIWRGNVANTCGKCHAEIAEAYRTSVHGEAMLRGVGDAPTCTDCHGEHRILGPAEPASPVFSANIPGETCGRCHANERLSEKYGIGTGKVTAFADSFHGLALRAGARMVANCSSCHGVHEIRPSTDPGSSVNRANLSQTCGKCHPGAGTAFAVGPVHGDGDGFGARVVNVVRVVYVCLIVMTIGFMLLHNFLDLSRKARRHMAPVAPDPVLESPVRMSRTLRWQHGMVMLSFIVLVYTGFALKYPESWWATPMLWGEAIFGLRGRIHRIAGVVMIVALLWHLAEIAVSRRTRACMRGLLWARRDLSVFAGTMAYYLRLRDERPHPGPFSYIEKAEYWAFLWGSAVMALTGFMLWFENTTLRYLPSWTADVATTIHFYEAILATLSILVWHFYWVIFDPDVYPMDWTWWDGHSPPSRVLEHREHDEDAHPEGS